MFARVTSLFQSPIWVGTVDEADGEVADEEAADVRHFQNAGAAADEAADVIIVGGASFASP